MTSNRNRLRMLPLFVALTATAIGTKGSDLQARLEQAPRAHPRLFLKNNQETSLKDLAAADPILAKLLAHVTAVADGLAEVPPVERRLEGLRLLGVSRTCLKRVTYLAMAARLTGNPTYAARAQTEMLAASAFTDWNPSHFLDVAEMTAALAIGYDWLHDALEPDAQKVIREAIVEKGLKTSLAGGWWVKTDNNWNQVCHGGLALGALAVLEDEPDLAATIIRRTIEHVPLAMAVYAPDGAYPEGPGYWDYGTTYNVLLLAALESAFGTDFGLARAPGFLESSDYLLHAAGPSGLLFNYSDCGRQLGVSPAMHWFRAQHRAPELLWREQPALEAFLAKPPRPANADGGFIPFLALWYEPAAGALSAPTTLHWRGRGRTPVAMHRSAWSAEATYVALKGGSPGANHAHMDVGSFVLDADGARWAEDLGSQSYHDLETKGIKLWDMKQDSERWSVFRLGPMSHNILVVDGQRQRVKGQAPITHFTNQGTMPHTIVDLSTVYEGQLARARRGIGLRPDRSVLVQDEVATLDRPATSIRWAMLTRATIESMAENTAVLRQGERRLFLTVLEPAGSELKALDMSKPPQPFDAPNPGVSQIAFELTLPARTGARLAVLLTPGSASNPPTAAVALSDLSDWSDAPARSNAP